MENPQGDIAHASARILNAATPELQILAIKQYFTTDACLSTPFCYIESAPESRERIIRFYIFLRILAPFCAAKIRRQSFTMKDIKGKMSLEMQFTPAWRGVDFVLRMLGWQQPMIPMHVFLHMKRDLGIVGPWRVYKQEVIYQPIDLLNAFGLMWVGKFFYNIVFLLMLAVVIIAQFLHIWPTPELSVYNECVKAAQEVFAVMILPPLTLTLGIIGFALGTFRWAKETLKGSLSYELKHAQRHYAQRIFILKHGGRWLIWKIIERLIGYPTLPNALEQRIEIPPVRLPEVPSVHYPEFPPSPLPVPVAPLAVPVPVSLQGPLTPPLTSSAPLLSPRELGKRLGL